MSAKGDYTCLDIIQSRVFSRLRNKTQIYSAVSDDHYHTRLVHTLEVKEYALAIVQKIESLLTNSRFANLKININKD